MTRTVYFCLVLIPLACGCQSARRESPAAMAPSPVARPPIVVEARTPSAIQQASAQSPATETLPPGDSRERPANPKTSVPSEEVRLDLLGAIEVALADNPDLVSLRQAEGVSRSALGVARTYPINPWIQVQVTPGQRQDDGGSGAVAHYVLLMQTLQLAGQQSIREEAALAALTGVRWNILQAEL
jgi:cobalt-zinc-cadmium efflux system outer membrane protein